VLAPLVSLLVALLLLPGAADAADYAGPLIDAHSHVPGAKAIDAYVAAMKRHNVSKVVLLGVGGVQKEDAQWIAAAARAYPDRVVPGQPIPDPTRADAAGILDVELSRTKARVMGEVHLRQVSRKIERNPNDAAFLDILKLGAERGIPIVIHYEVTATTGAQLEKALGARATRTSWWISPACTSSARPPLPPRPGPSTRGGRRSSKRCPTAFSWASTCGRRACSSRPCSTAS